MSEQTRKGFLKGVFSTSSGTIVAILFNFVTITAIVKALPEAEFGVYVLTLAAVNALRIIAGLGLDLTLVKFISGDENRRKGEALASILTVRIAALLTVAAVLGAGGSLLAELFDARIAEFLPQALMIFGLMSLTELFYHLLQGMKAFSKFALLQVVSALVKFSVILAFVQQDSLTLSRALLMEIAALATLLVAQIILLRGEFAGMKFSKGVTRDAFKFGVPLYLNNMLTFVYQRASVFIMAFLLSPVSIAYYEVASKIPEGFQRLFRSFINVYFPMLSGLFSEGKKEQAARFMNNALFYLAIIGLSLAFWSIVFRGEIVTLIFSENYRASTLAFALLTVDFFLMILGYTMGYSLVSAGDSAAPVKINTITSTVSLIANFVFIPMYGFIGAVYAILIMHGLGVILNYRYLLRLEITANLGALLKPCLHFLAFCLVAVFLNDASIQTRIALVATYFLTNVLFYAEIRGVLGASMTMLRRRVARV